MSRVSYLQGRLNLPEKERNILKKVIVPKRSFKRLKILWPKIIERILFILRGFRGKDFCIRKTQIDSPDNSLPSMPFSRSYPK